MKEKLLYALWVCMYVLCVGLGTVQDAQGFGKALLMLTGVIFFLPGAALLRLGIREKNPKILLRVSVISAVSLSATLVLLIVNFLSIGAPSQTGKVLSDLLLLISVPMFCAQYWVLSLFLWASLLSAGIFLRPYSVNNP